MLHKNYIIGSIVVVAVIGGFGYYQYSGGASNPFRDYYNFYTQGGVMQICWKEKLGDKFDDAYNGTFVSRAIADTHDACGAIYTQTVSPTLNSFIDIPTVRECEKAIVGEDFDRVASDKLYYEQLDAERKREIMLGLDDCISKSGINDEIFPAFVKYVN